jgi:hypothetical protein
MSYLDTLLQSIGQELTATVEEQQVLSLENQRQISQDAIAYQGYDQRMQQIENAADQAQLQQLQSLMEHDQKHGTNLAAQYMQMIQQANNAFAQGYGGVMGGF